MNTKTLEEEAPLPKYFEAESHGGEWHLFCKVCGKGWSLDKTDTRPGNILYLLNHARGHEEAT